MYSNMSCRTRGIRNGPTLAVKSDRSSGLAHHEENTPRKANLILLINVKNI